MAVAAEQIDLWKSLPKETARLEFKAARNQFDHAVVIFGHKKFADLDRDDRIRACYQHCVLKYVMASPMTNQTLRERFDLGEGKTSVVSQTIAATMDEASLSPMRESAVRGVMRGTFRFGLSGLFN